MSHFRERLEQINPEARDRRWIFVPYDQLNDRIGPLADAPPREIGIVVVESAEKAARRPYHRQKLALVLANQRHFALEQAERGVAVRHLTSAGSFAEALEPLAADLGPLLVMEPAERELREELAPLIDAGRLEVVPHDGWLTTRQQFHASAGEEPPWRMDSFYRRVRKESGVLMEDGRPQGGKFSFDAENRKSWNGEPPAPEPPSFEPDEVTREVGELIEDRYERHPGRLDLAALPATRADAERVWEWALAECLDSFGPFEDAMSTRSRGLFHTRVSALVNLHRLLPSTLIDDVAGHSAPLASREGFIRQLLGWREFMRHVHRETDGLRTLPDRNPDVAPAPGDGGWATRAGEAWPTTEEHPPWTGGAQPSALNAGTPLPAAYWGEPSGLACLDTVVAEVWDDGYTHHIPRLMVLANLATLLGVSPRQLTDWFWVAFTDAYDWVVEPNVLGMGTFAVGGLFTTKPYVSGANYIHKMGDYCSQCRFDPKSSCPITPLYWSFLDRNRQQFDSNPRMNLVMANLKRRPDDRRKLDKSVFEWVLDALGNGRELDGTHAPDA